MTDDPDTEMIRSSTAKLAERYGRAYWLQCTWDGHPMDELWQALGDLGFLGMAIPEQYGGSGGSVRQLAVVSEELAAHGVLSLSLIISAAMGSVVLARHGSEAQRARYLPHLASGELRVGFAITEPDTGPYGLDIRTQATREGQGYRLRGHKIFVSNFDATGSILLVARTSPSDAAPDEQSGLSLFMVDADSQGVDRSRMKVEVKGPEHPWVLYLDDVFVPESAQIGPTGRGRDVLFDALDPGFIAVAATCVGLGRYAVGKAVHHAQTHRPLGAHPSLAHPLAEVHTQLELSALATERAARLFDEGSDASLYATMARVAAADAAIAAVDQAIEIHGTSGFTADADLISLWTWARLMRAVPISRELALDHIKEHGLGLLGTS
ncbi:MAG: acyl-CoA dehydrogenase family protein [Myxococcota bacterium]